MTGWALAGAGSRGPTAHHEGVRRVGRPAAAAGRTVPSRVAAGRLGESPATPVGLAAGRLADPATTTGSVTGAAVPRLPDVPRLRRLPRPARTDAGRAQARRDPAAPAGPQRLL